jgi:glutamate-1-semialdehyde 2,1-aminomutase
VFDEVFLGFRLARGGAQDYFDVRADLVTYGKSLGGGLPVGVVCGTRACMRRFRDDRPSDVCLARGTFNSHPYVMATMNEFLRALDEPEIARTYDGLDERWDGRAEALNRRLEALELPVRVANLTSVMTTLYLVPGRYNWMFQFYLRAEGLALGWIGTGRFIFSHDISDATFQAVTDRFVAAAGAMRRDGFWWSAAELTNRSIKRRVLRELVSAGFARRASGPATRP